MELREFETVAMNSQDIERQKASKPSDKLMNGWLKSKGALLER